MTNFAHVAITHRTTDPTNFLSRNTHVTAMYMFWNNAVGSSTSHIADGLFIARVLLSCCCDVVLRFWQKAR